jgi:hypothetical protein
MIGAARSLPAAEVGEKIRALKALDSYGVRKKLRVVISTPGAD